MQVTAQTAQQMQYILMTFEIRKDGKPFNRWTFLINPETYIQNEPVRANVVQTLGGAYIDAFGRGLTTIRISGVSGWRLRAVTNVGLTDGWQHWQAFLENVYRFFIDQTNQDDKHTYELRFYNWMDKEYYAVYFIDNLQWQRQAPQDNLWRRYDFTLVCLYPIPAPKDPSSLQIVGQTVINKDDKVLSNVVNLDLLDIENSLWISGAIIKQLVGCNNLSLLNANEQQTVKTYGYYDRIEPNEELTNYNFPGIYQYTGKLGEQVHPQGSALSLVDNAIYPLAWAINLFRTNRTDKINIPYGYVLGNDTSWSMKLNNLAYNLTIAYPNHKPIYLINELMKAHHTMDKFKGHEDLFASSGVGLS
jgi:hypothetical protein